MSILILIVLSILLGAELLFNWKSETEEGHAMWTTIFLVTLIAFLIVVCRSLPQ